MNSSDIKDFLTEVIDNSSGYNRLDVARGDLKADIRHMVISVLVVAVICVGIMYLRFRVFGR